MPYRTVCVITASSSSWLGRLLVDFRSFQNNTLFLLVGSHVWQKAVASLLPLAATTVFLADCDESVVDSAMGREHADSYRVMRWLEKQDPAPETVIMPLCGGLAYYSCLLKRAGLGFGATRICILETEPTVCALEKRGRLVGSLAVLEADFMERESVRLADGIIGGSPDVQAWMQRRGWIVTCPPHENQTAPDPSVTVVLGHFNRVTLLKQAIESIERQTYANFEVVLVDGGSTRLEVFDYLKSREDSFRQKGWKIVYDTNRYIGAARNLGAKEARGEMLFFMDDDNYLMPECLATLVAVAQRTKADIVTSANKRFVSKHPPNFETDGNYIWVPLGGALARGAFGNVFGDAGFLISSVLFKSLGGFTEDFGIGGEDAEFLANAVLRGATLFPIPRPLYWYRINAVSMSTATGGATSDATRRRGLRPYVAAFGDDVGLILSYAVECHSGQTIGAMTEKITKRLGFNLLNRSKLLRLLFYRLRSLKFACLMGKARP